MVDNPNIRTTLPAGVDIVSDDPDERVSVLHARRTTENSWHERDVMGAIERESLQWWNEQNEEQQKSVIVIVRDILLKMIEDPTMWLPVSVVTQSDERLDIFFSIHLSEIDQEVIRRRVETEEDMIRRRGELVDLRDKRRQVAEDDAPTLEPPGGDEP